VAACHGQAVRLGKAPSTVSHAARQLEERFDALLFDRRRYRLQLTPAGQLLTHEAARLMQDVSRLTQRVKQIANGWEDRLHIVTDEILEFASLVPVIHRFDALKSGVGLRVTHEVLAAPGKRCARVMRTLSWARPMSRR
jgi:DNA-binding transcriptional LysR family regulator